MAKCVSNSNYFWKIEDFRSTDKKVSPVLFSVGLKWLLRYFHFKDDDTEKCFLHLECVNPSGMSPTWQFRAAVLFVHNDGVYSIMKHAKYNLGDKEWCVWADNFTNVSRVYGQIKDITFCLRITPVDLTNFLKNSRNVGEDYSDFLCTNNLSRDFEKFFNNDSHSDFVLKCGQRSFYVNKTVLSARSDFFAGLFCRDMTNGAKGSVNIEDVEPDILELVLHYVYSGQIPELMKNTLQSVYIAADRFGVESLKEKCFSLLVDKFVTCPKEVSDKEKTTKPTEVVQVESNECKEIQLVKDLFVSREWRLLSHEFPQTAQEMCKSFLLKN